MNILIVDDERLVLENTSALVKRVFPNDTIHTFQFAKDALGFLEHQKVDIALLDIAMPEMSGIQLAKQCKMLCPLMNVLFVTGYSDYALDAFKVHASGYLLKPLREMDLRNELEHLRFPLIQVDEMNGLFIQCFGNFEVFFNGKPLKFKYSKTKELLAYLIDRNGARVSSGEAIGILWEDKPISLSLKSQWRNCVADLLMQLKRINKVDVIIKSRDFIAVDTNLVSCDYYRFLSGDSNAVNQFRNEYMEQYSWSEFTL